MPTIVDELRRALGPDVVLAGDDLPERNRADWSGLPPTRPLAVLRPRTTDQVATALRLCHRHRQPVVPQGGLTGLCGGGRAGDGEVALSLERMVGVEEIDPATATMTVLAGTPLERAQAAAEEAGFLLPLDLGARGSCAVGGNISTNAGGNRVIRYGMTREMVLGLEVVLADGTVLPGLNKLLKNNAGYDLKHLFVGSEGTLGVVTRAVLRLHPRPSCVQAALCALPSFPAVVELLKAARAGLGPTLSAFEVMWNDYYRFVSERTPGIRAPVPPGHPLYVLVEQQGIDEAADEARFEAWLERMVEAEVVADAALARSLADARSFWALRDAAGELRQTLGPHVSYDIGLPTGKMGAYVEACRARLEAELPGVVALFYGHIGDGNLHIVAAVPGAERQPKDAIDRVVYELVRETGGGTVSAEHGIGTTKRAWLPYARSPEELALMRNLKRALDPAGILNPGKVV